MDLITRRVPAAQSTLHASRQPDTRSSIESFQTAGPTLYHPTTLARSPTYDNPVTWSARTPARPPSGSYARVRNPRPPAPGLVVDAISRSEFHSSAISNGSSSGSATAGNRSNQANH